MNHCAIVISLFCTSCAALPTAPETASETASEIEETLIAAPLTAASSTKKVETSASETSRDFAGLRFGVGVSLTVDIGDNDRVDEASIVDAKVAGVSKAAYPSSMAAPHGGYAAPEPGTWLGMGVLLVLLLGLLRKPLAGRLAISRAT